MRGKPIGMARMWTRTLLTPFSWTQLVLDMASLLLNIQASWTWPDLKEFRWKFVPSPTRSFNNRSNSQTF
jgi:hypothetical protein